MIFLPHQNSLNTPNIFTTLVQFSCSVVFYSLWPRGLQHARPPCPSPIPGVYSNSGALSRWRHPTISSCLSLLLPPSIFPSIRVFSNKSVLHIRWPEYWSFGFSISPSSEYSGLIFFRMDWLDLLAVQRTFKSLLQHHSSTLPLPITFSTALPLAYSYLHLEYSLLLLQLTDS